MRVNAEIAVTYRAFPYKENTANHRGELYLCTLLLLENRTAAGTAVTSRFGNSCSTREPGTYQRVLQGREEAERAGARRREEAGGLSASSTGNRPEPGSSQRCPVAEQVAGTGETQEDPLKHKGRSLSCGLVRLRDKSRRNGAASALRRYPRVTAPAPPAAAVLPSAVRPAGLQSFLQPQLPLSSGGTGHIPVQSGKQAAGHSRSFGGGSHLCFFSPVRTKQ